MPGTTPNRHYPYPLGSDSINPPRDIKALAESVDADFASQITAADLTAALAGYLRLTGGNLSGALSIDPGSSAASLSLRNLANTPYAEFRTHDGATRLGFIQHQSGQATYQTDLTTGFHLFRVGSVEKFRVSPAGAVVSGALTVSGAASVGAGLNVTGALAATGNLTIASITATGNITATGDINANDATFSGGLSAASTARFSNRTVIGGDGHQLQLVDTVVTTAGTNYDVQLEFYGQGTVTAPGTLAGYLGYAGNPSLLLVNAAPGSIIIDTLHDILLQADEETIFYSAGAERGRAGASFMWGKSVGGITHGGVELFEGGTIYSTTIASATPNMLLRHNVDLDNEAFIQFSNAAGGIIADIRQDTVTPVGIKIVNATVTAPSDYRMKDELGPVEDALARLMEMQPKHLAWKDGGAEFDGFIAHELAAVVPDAVFGEKDGEEMQGLDATKIIPLLVAAVQDLAAEVASLKAGA